ncbi:MAG: class I SAM-dependent methyltransferase [Gemmatimonadaceae bacterium]
MERRLAAHMPLADSEVTLGGQPVVLVRPANAEELISEEDFAHDERLPYWADLWPSAAALAEHVVRLPGAGARLLELGCGLGLVAAAAARAGFDVEATDYYDHALDFASLNAWRISGRAIHTRHLDWRALPPDLGTFDVVVASDVLYERPYAALVAEVLSRTLAPGGRCWLADPGRVALGAFISECEARGLEVRADIEVPYVDGAIRQRITIHEVVRGDEGRAA